MGVGGSTREERFFRPQKRRETRHAKKKAIFPRTHTHTIPKLTVNDITKIPQMGYYGKNSVRVYKKRNTDS